MNYNEKKQKTIQTLCSEFGCTKAELFSQSRKRNKVFPRHLLALWIRRNSTKSFHEIGKEIRTIPCDHTTAMNSVKEAQNLIDTDEVVRAIFEKLPKLGKKNPNTLENQINELKSALASFAPRITSLSYRSQINIAHSPQKLA